MLKGQSFNILRSKRTVLSIRIFILKEQFFQGFQVKEQSCQSIHSKGAVLPESTLFFNANIDCDPITLEVV